MRALIKYNNERRRKVRKFYNTNLSLICYSEPKPKSEILIVGWYSNIYIFPIRRKLMKEFLKKKGFYKIHNHLITISAIYDLPEITSLEQFKDIINKPHNTISF